MEKKNVSKEEITLARNASLYDFMLENFPADVVEEGSFWLRYRENTSIGIPRSDRGYAFIDFSVNGKRGNPIEFLMEYLGFSFVEAVQALNDYPGDFSYSPHTSQVPQPITKGSLCIPKAVDGSPNCVYAYLTETRQLFDDCIKKLMDEGLLFEDERHNAIFLNKEHDWAERRGTNTYYDNRCKHCDGCDQCEYTDHDWCKYMDTCPRYQKQPFHGVLRNSSSNGYWSFQSGSGKTDTVYVCEAAIDAISLCHLHRFQKNATYVSIGGVGKQETIERLKKEYAHVILAVDNDPAGEECRRRNPDLEAIIPEHKDWNDDWCAL